MVCFEQNHFKIVKDLLHLRSWAWISLNVCYTVDVLTTGLAQLSSSSISEWVSRRVIDPADTVDTLMPPARCWRRVIWAGFYRVATARCADDMVKPSSFTLTSFWRLHLPTSLNKTHQLLPVRLSADLDASKILMDDDCFQEERNSVILLHDRRFLTYNLTISQVRYRDELTTSNDSHISTGWIMTDVTVENTCRLCSSLSKIPVIVICELGSACKVWTLSEKCESAVHTARSRCGFSQSLRWRV